VFYKNSQEIYQVRELEAIPWLVHGFGTRWSAVPDHNLAILHQIHSDRCVVAGGASGRIGEGDALLENTPGHVVAVKTADCIPVLLVDERNRAVAAVHAGWRGTEQRIVAKTIARMAQEFSTRPEDLRAAIGPGIGPCCYEVGPEVAQRFGIETAEPVKLDLAEYNRRQLIEAGVAEDRVYVVRLCTRCLGEDFFSFRREKEQAGRMYSLIGIRQGCDKL
jgi:YfiH family protein